jgi:peptidoglycan/xylan/chitin deacetylase (PgdA/CDA1 family)
MTGVRDAVAAVSIDGAVAWLARKQGSHGCMLTFHRAAPAGAWAGLPNRDFYLDIGFLDRLLSALKTGGWRIVTLDTLLEQARTSGNERLVNFSVDDCYRDTAELVVPLFRKHDVPVTLFVTTGIPDGTLPMAQAGLEATLIERDRVTVNGSIVEAPTADAKRNAYRSISASWETGGADSLARHYEAFCRDNGVDAEAIHRQHGISWEMLEPMRQDLMVEIGAHTVTHPHVSQLPDGAAQAEVAGSRERLRARLNVACRHFAFPFGRAADCGDRDFAIAREAGYASASTTHKGLLAPRQDLFRLPRNTVNGSIRSVAYVQALLTGAGGVAARALGRG